ncbi:MAG: cyclic nucleotide-binding domain-containing protein [Deltaproteobacteria bacterium]|nr:cyclic nucleotide-binding domain-containing protein [Deltaproteobacteria bacterium]
MSLELETLRQEAEKLLEQGQALAAVRAYVAVLRHVPRDYRVRIALADALARAGEKSAAAHVYGAAARSCIEGGLPLTAIVAIRAAEALELNAREHGVIDGLIEELATTYGRGSPRIGSVGGRMNVTYPKDTTVDNRELRRAMSVADLVAEATQVGTDLSKVGDMPPAFPEVALLSKLSPKRFMAVVKAIWVQRLPTGHMLIRRGSPGSSCYLVAAGKVRVTAPDDAGIERQLALLGPGTLVGEMAVITGSPRLADVTVVEPADILELDPEALAAMAEELDQLAPVLDQLAQNRWMKNLLEQSPLFRPFSNKDRQKLLQRCSAYQVPQGTTLFAQGGEVKGIYLLLRGEVLVEHMNQDHSEVVFAATMVAGATLGTRENLQDSRSDATAVSVTPCTVLFLSKSAVQRLIKAVPEFAQQLKAVSEKRVRDVEDAEQRATLRIHAPLKQKPPAEDVEDPEEEEPTTIDFRRRQTPPQDEDLDEPTLEEPETPAPQAEECMGCEDTVRAKITPPVEEPVEKRAEKKAKKKTPDRKARVQESSEISSTMHEEEDGLFTSAPPVKDED